MAMERKDQKRYIPAQVEQRAAGASHHTSVDPFVVLPNGRIESVYSRFKEQVEESPTHKKRTGKNKRNFRR